jgi:hypothetical protein
LEAFRTELLAFPHGKHDDQVDSVSQFLGWVSKQRAQPRIPVAPEVIYPDDWADF